MPDSTRRRTLAPLLLLSLALLTGCANLGYYAQAVRGHLDILGRARPVDEVLDDPATPAALRARLAAVQRARDFAVRELALPDNASYRRYADLERPYAVWNVFAAPALSLDLKEWCFVVVGCVNYRGFFSHEEASAAAAALRAQGYDVYIGGVSAYSTLGWSDDPLLNTMLSRGETEAAGFVFHELAHQRLYVRDDTAFNESFAVTVELEGVRRWLQAAGDSPEYARFLARRERREQFLALVLGHRERLARAYAAAASPDDKRFAKQTVLYELRRDYETLKAGWQGDTSFDAWMAQDLNNAKLASVGLYHRYVGAFRALLRAQGDDLAAFYRAVEELARRPRDERIAALAALPVPENQDLSRE